jgi:hypothetical protein
VRRWTATGNSAPCMLPPMLRLAAIVILIATAAIAQSPLVLPVTGEWFALDGPPCESCERSVAHKLLLVPLDPFGRPAPSCRNRPVLAPADGTVIAVATDDTFGHHIAIAAGDNRTMVIGFLLEGSVSVAPGDSVAAGEEIARCGGPALHVHMQASPDPLDAEAEGLAMPFRNLDVRTPGGCMPATFLYRGQGTCAP